MVGESTTLNLGDWSPYFEQFKQHQDYQLLRTFLIQEKQYYHILPSRKNWFLAFKLCSLKATQVVILGQDPYPNPVHAHGLCFSVPQNTYPIPPSLKNIFKAIEADIGILPNRPNLSYLAKQGVLLLNTVLTVRAGQPASHQNQGWETLTDSIIKTISTHKERVVFLFWGRFAQQKTKLIDTTKHLILTSAHPSPLSAYRGFLTCHHFSKTNIYLKNHHKTEVDWQ